MKKNLHTLTASSCEVCERLSKEGLPDPIIGKYFPQASNNHISQSPVHNWYFFPLGYSPTFVRYIIKKYGILKSNIVLDPFSGSGTTLLVTHKQLAT